MSMDIKGWKPTEGHRRAEVTVQMLEADGLSTGHRFSPEFRWRMVQTIAGAIDSALADGSEQDALASVVGNGHGHKDENPTGTWTHTEYTSDDLAKAKATGDAHAAPKKRGPKKGAKRGRRPRAVAELA